MNVGQCKLSVCIATYNRAPYLRESLNALVDQLSNEVEIIVADGASTDATPQLMDHFCSRYSQIKYLRLSEKGGVDRDYDLAVEAASGEYCWLLSDDDPITKNAIAKILTSLQTSSYSLIILNSTVMDLDLCNVLSDLSIPIDDDVELDGEQMSELAIRCGNYLTFIGCVVIRRELWFEREREKYYGFEFIHFAVIFQQNLPLKILLKADPFMLTRYGNAQWTQRGLEIWARKWPQLVWGMDTLSTRAKSCLSAVEPLKSMRFLLVQRAKGNINFRRLTSIRSVAGTTALFRSLLVCLIPELLLRRMLIWYMNRDSKRYAVSLYELRLK